MSAKRDVIFRLEGETLNSIPYRPFRQGLFGTELESALQGLLAQNPDLLAGHQIDPSSEEPLRFLLLCREMPVAGGALDLLFVDENAVLTLVEAKLAQNPESSRTVIGQIVEYASAAVSDWDAGEIRERAVQFHDQQGRNFEDELEAFTAPTDFDTEAFWDLIADNLAKRRLRLIVAGDELRASARRAIEFLNAEMQTVEVLGLEIRCYGDHSSDLTIVPMVLGQTQAAAERRSGGAIIWHPSRLRTAWEEFGEPLRSRLTRVLDLALERNVFMPGHSQKPGFGMSSGSGKRFISFGADGGLYCTLEAGYYPSRTERDEFAAQLKSLGLLDADLDLDEVVSGRSLKRKLPELSEREMQSLLELVLRFCG